MVTALVIMGGLGLIVGAGLAVASKMFYVYVDPKVEAVDAELPGANCGGCGKPGCSANAEAIVAGTAAPNSCVAAGPEVAEAIAAIMGVKIEAVEPDIARPGCYYGIEDADLRYLYNGIADCRAVALHGGGMKVCNIGCLGLGTCANACPFNAITMGPDNLPVVHEGRCTGCGTCERVCPKHIINLSSVTRRILREYTTDECTTPCQRACPAGIDIREYIHQIAEGNPQRAVEVVKERNPFPAVIGRICPRPCELECRRNLVDEPVAINYLKRYAADVEKQSGHRVLPYKAPETGRKVAVIGGGVEGLSTAFFVARLGHAVTVYEATSELGGLLKSAIATARLPREVLQWDVDGILKMGVEAQTDKMVGRDFTAAQLLSQGAEAVFLALGGWDSRLARGGASGPESPIPGTYLMVDVVRQGIGDNQLAIRSDVVISGGDSLALEAAQRCQKLGAERITILFREDALRSSVSEEDVTAAGLEGVTLVFNAALKTLYGKGETLTRIDYIDTASGESARIDAQTLILSAGRFPEMIFVKQAAEEAIQEGELAWKAIEPYKKPAFHDQVGLFAEGDALTDYSAAIKAIGAGRRSAASIHQMMNGLDPQLADHVITPQSRLQDVDHVEGVGEVPRRIMPLSGAKELADHKELEKGFSPEDARIEAERCLQCGLICYERDREADSEARPAVVA